MEIRKQIKEVRNKKGYTYKALADKCPKISPGDISNYEKGKGNPGLKKLEVLAKALDCKWELK